MNVFSRKKSVWWLAAILASVAVLWPLFRPGYFISDDGEWMVIRLSAFYQSLSSGQIPVRFLGRLNHSYGYPVANFLYPGFMYIGSVLHRMGLSFTDAVKAIFAVSVMGSVAFLYFALRRRFERLPSFMGAVSFLAAPYLLYDIYTRGSVGEVLALLPAAAMLFGFTSGAYWLVPPALGFLIISHNTAAVLLSGALAFLFIDFKKPFAYLWHGALGIGMAAFFWVPAFFERNLVRFDAVTVSDPAHYFISLNQAFLLGLPTVLSLALWFAIPVKKTHKEYRVVALIIAGYLLTLPVTGALWHLPFLGKFVQFPYRFLLIPVLLGPFLVSRVFETHRGWKRTALAVVFAGLWLVPIVMMERSISFVNRAEGYYTTNEATTTVADEYMPRWASRVPSARSSDVLEVVTGNVNVSAHTFEKETIKATVQAKTDGILQINKIYYPGWGVSMDGILTPIHYDNPFGFIQVDVTPGTHTLYAAFRETPMRFIADLVSIASVLGYLVLFRRLSKRS